MVWDISDPNRTVSSSTMLFHRVCVVIGSAGERAGLYVMIAGNIWVGLVHNRIFAPRRVLAAPGETRRHNRHITRGGGFADVLEAWL